LVALTVYVVVAVGLTDCVPLKGAEPESPAVHETVVAFVVDHASVDDPPEVMLVGFAESVAVGSCATAGLIVRVAGPDFEGSKTDVAVTVATVVLAIDEEVATFPVWSIVAALAGVTLIAHVTAGDGLLVPFTVAANCWLVPAVTVAAGGLTTTDDTVVVVPPPPDPEGPAPQPVATRDGIEMVKATTKPTDSLDAILDKNAAKLLLPRIDVSSEVPEYYYWDSKKQGWPEFRSALSCSGALR
jgi:hypothetical protein